MAYAFLLLRCSLPTPCLKQSTVASASSAHLRGPSALRPQPALPVNVQRNCARLQSRNRVVPVRAVASAEPSTVKIITQGRHIEVTPAIKAYVVRIMSIALPDVWMQILSIANWTRKDHNGMLTQPLKTPASPFRHCNVPL